MFSLYSLDPNTWKRWRTLADQCQQRLTAQRIIPGDPGPILGDVSAMLEFVGSAGLVTKSRNASLPAERLPELNAKVSHPIELGLKRALLRDYPNLAGIFILLRVMDLLQRKGNRVVVCQRALEFWRGLNGTEQYFALLEAFLFQAHSSVLGGERSREEPQAFNTITVFLGQQSERWRNFSYYESARLFGPHGELPPWMLFVQQQLGLVEARPGQFSERERKYWGGRGWLAGGVKLTAWGTAVTWALLEFLKEMDEQEDEPDNEPPEMDLFHPLLAEGETELDEAPDETESEPAFGMLRPIFHPYFPEWQAVYARPGREVGLGAHIFKVKLAGWRGGNGNIWRRFAVPPNISLDGLAQAILHAFNFDNDHLYDFRYRDHRGRQRVYNHFYAEEGPYAEEITVGETDLAVKDEMLFTFDYGDNWEFELRLEQIDAGPCRLRRPKVVGSEGKAPQQYES